MIECLLKILDYSMSPVNLQAIVSNLVRAPYGYLMNKRQAVLFIFIPTLSFLTIYMISISNTFLCDVKTFPEL
jgi:hypothetical protein